MVLIANIFTSLAQFGVNTYVSTYMGFLGTGAVLTGIIAGLYFGVAFLMRPISGPAITVLNKKTLMIIVYAAGIFINLGYAFFPTIGVFVAMRVLHGMQLAFFGSLALTVASNSLPPSKMASGIGVYGLSYIASQAFGPSLAVFAKSVGESLIGGERGGFMGIFILAAIFAVISVIPCILLPKERKITEAERASLGAWYKNIVAKEAIGPSTVAMLMAIGMVLINTYLIPYGVWRNIDNISIYFTVSAFITLLVRPIAGKLGDKYGSAKVFYPAISIYIIAFVSLSFATDLTLVIVAAVCAAIGMSAAGPAVQVMVMQSVPQIRRGVASNTNFLGMDLGSFLGPSIAGFILARFDYAVMFRLVAIPMVLAIIVFALSWKTHLRHCEALEQCENTHLDPIEETEELMEEILG